VQKTLGEGLSLKDDDSFYYIMEDFRAGLQYLRNGRSLCREGLAVHLDAFKVNVFMNFRELKDLDGQVKRLHDQLGGRGVPDVLTELQELYLGRVLVPFRAVLEKSFLVQAVREGAATGEVNDFFREAVSGFLPKPRNSLVSEAGARLPGMRHTGR
jgi:hypothetical protein